ncbi:MAG: sigma-70 family RNA polymerase sigma factor [Saprospirales bacterium]|nr:sigma-70 family RNA polymerase sigma factor [Saprospirales bacterium]
MNTQEFQIQVLPVKDKLFRLAFRMTGNALEAEDLVQEVFLKVWNGRMELESVQNIEAWCMRIAKNLAIDRLRSKHWQTRTDEEPIIVETHEASPYTITEQQDTLEHIRQIMHQLAEKHRQVMELRDIEELSYEEICEVLSMTMAQVKTNLHRARQAVREALIKLNVSKN